MFEKAEENKLTQMHNIDPLRQLENFKKKYSKKNNKLLNTYLHMISDQEKDYFPEQKIDEQTLQILSRQQIFSARFIYLVKFFNLKNKEILDTFFSKYKSTLEKFKKLQKHRQYSERFLADIGYLSRKQTNLPLKQEFKIQNYKFYSGKGIQNLHLKEGDYDFLQDRHDYIQWMFPNHFHSMFNSNSWPMSYLEVIFFRKSKELGLRLFKSISIFFDFMGIKLLKDFNIAIISLKRLRQALLINCHNHLRLRRILACLSITGFRLIALRLIDFLAKLIEEDKRFSRLSYTYKRQWEVYGDNQKQKALELCFHTENNFPQDHEVLRSFFNVKEIAPLKIFNQDSSQQNRKEEHPSKKQKSISNFDYSDKDEKDQKNKKDGIDEKEKEIEIAKEKQKQKNENGNGNEIDLEDTSKKLSEKQQERNNLEKNIQNKKDQLKVETNQKKTEKNNSEIQQLKSHTIGNQNKQSTKSQMLDENSANIQS